VLDVADTAAPVPGHQAPARYDGESGGDGVLPLPLYEGLAGRLIPTILQAQRCTGAQRLAGLQRRVKRLRHSGPATLLRLRGESPLASPEGRPWSAAPSARHSGTGGPRHTVLQAWAREGVEPAQRASAHSGHHVTRFPSTRDQAGTWARSRRGVRQVDGAAQGVHPRWVVTARAHARPQGLSQPLAWARGQAENESNAHTRSLPSDRPAGHRFAAKPLRLWWPAAASVCLATWRREVCRTPQGASATRETIQ
jgi:hypothetical protein